MTALARLGLLLLLPLVACSSRSTSAGPDAATDAAGLDAGTDLRGARYCEILLATMAGADVHTATVVQDERRDTYLQSQ